MSQGLVRVHRHRKVGGWWAESRTGAAAAAPTEVEIDSDRSTRNAKNTEERKEKRAAEASEANEHRVPQSNARGLGGAQAAD